MTTFDDMEPKREDTMGMVGRGLLGVRWLVLAMTLMAGTAQAKVMAGVRLPDAISLQGKELLLEHIDLKKKLFFELYVWGLYLEQKPASTQQAIAFQGPKQLQLHFRRSIKREQLAEAFRTFLSNSRVLRSPAMKLQSEQLIQSLKSVRKGDSLLITYLPDKGLLISGEGSRGAMIPGKAFADALFDAWLSENPIYAR
ncbi:chalcone isomerase family protein [Archangium lansingense]|uniref:Chalcone isomerase family protein n=1 Tax=Archangium lansingense TaxID=2995310 RepID=A0ABT3ZXM7_9BACT|nr:chalcone isomerase family protein [Archangium lansinium]MCY1074146.1 chalcone isomerase family protein [Archangium lansinium]